MKASQKLKQLESARQALQAFDKLERKNCLSYEFVRLKLGCSSNRASELTQTVRGEEILSHKHVVTGYCRVCGHYGSDCTGKVE